MGRRPFYETQHLNPFRKPTWRVDRAQDLIRSGKNFSQKRDDGATGIAVAYLRDVARCKSERRLRRVQERFEHVHRALQLWEAFDYRRVEIEARILARQDDMEIGLELNVPAATIQAFRDLFYAVDDRLDAPGYILFQVLGLHPQRRPYAVQLMQASAFFHGPLVIAPWLQYLREPQPQRDLTTDTGRLMAKLGLLVAVHSLPDDEATQKTLARLAPLILKGGKKTAISVSASCAFRDATAAIVAELDLPSERLPPLAYGPMIKTRANHQHKAARRQNRKAA